MNQLIDNYSLNLNAPDCNNIQNFNEAGIDNKSNTLQDSPFSYENYIENLIDYAIKLQELEANSISTNILTFLYTFLSGTLIGVATYFTKKSYDNIRQIKENKELLTNLDSRTLFYSLYMHTQRTYSTMQVFSVSLDAIQDNNSLSKFINKYVPELNVFINEMWHFFKEENVKILSNKEKRRLLNEINEIENLIENLHVSLAHHPLIANSGNDFTKTAWKEQLDNIRTILKK